MARNLLSKINQPSDFRNFSMADLAQLCSEIREEIIDLVSTKEGHLGASLGVVELTVILHYVFNTPYDCLIWDVGHQAYGHKLITGRRDVFITNRQMGGISGFPKINESIYDAFGVGHSSTSISAALGRALAAQLKDQKNRHFIAVIGDASIVSGMAFEALNHLGDTNVNVLVVLNDNTIGIDPSVGAMKGFWEDEKAIYSFFNKLNIKYYGSYDGHTIHDLVSVFNQIKQHQGPKFIRIKTTKGKGFKNAEQNQVLFHAPGKFNKVTGEVFFKNQVKYQHVFGVTLLQMAKQNKKVFALTPAMPTGSGLLHFMECFPERAIDVGIAEQHAVTLAAGLALEGFKVYCCMYSTFLQRAYDQLIHDVALQKLPVVFCVDRAGLVGEDGATHQGAFDLAFLQPIPHLMIWTPKNARQLRMALYESQFINQPLVIRYPRGATQEIDWEIPFSRYKLNIFEKIKDGNQTAIISVGTIFKEVEHAIETINIAHFHLFQVKPLPIDQLNNCLKCYKNVVIVEEGVKMGGVAMYIKNLTNLSHVMFHSLGIDDLFIEHATHQQQLELCGLNSKAIRDFVLKL